MRLVKIGRTLVLVVLILPFWAVADEDAQEFGRNLPGILNKLPQPLRTPLATYLDVVRPQNYGSKGSNVEDDNPGIIDHFERTMNSPQGQCLNLKTQLFYSYVHKHEPQILPANVVKADLSLVPYPEISPDLSPSLMSTTQDYKHEDGWVWKKAMQLSNGDANEAFRMIGMCGHDDYGTKRSDGFDSNNIDETLFAELSRSQPDAIASIADDLQCPEQQSAFYAPGSLDRRANISKNFKERIQNLQFTSVQRDNTLGAKYYHVYASGYVACRMIENGVAPALTPFYAEKFASVYRRTVTCRAAYPSRLAANKVNQKYQKALASSLRAGAASFSVSDFLSKQSSEQCQEMLGDSEYGRFLCPKDPQRKLSPRQFEKMLAIVFAAKVYHEQQNCPDVVDQSAISLGEVLRFVSASEKTAFDFGKPFSCENIPTSICPSVQKVLDQWRIDFEWTMAQHRAGAEFAARHCHPKKSDVLELSNKSCKVGEDFFLNN